MAPHFGTRERMRDVQIQLDGIVLHGDLIVPTGAGGLVLFAHGSGSSRFSPRNRAVAATLQDGGIATLLLDLLTSDEEQIDEMTRTHRFDVAMLASRLVAATEWAVQDESTRRLPVGYFGASTGAAAALIAAARLPRIVRVVVSRGGRPDLAGSALASVRAATLLIVGGADHEVLALNTRAFAMLHGEKRLEVVPGATHLFEERGALERVGVLARDWFVAQLTPPAEANATQAW